jgi:hypothetical protein
MKRTLILILGMIVVVVGAFGQAADTPFQVRYAVNLNLGDSFINLSNDGASSTVAFPTQNGNVCANVYTFEPDEQLISCCSCLITPNGLKSLSVKNDLISNTLTPSVPTSVVVKLLASTGTGGSCNPSTVGTGANVLMTGMLAWGSTYRQITTTVTTPSPYWWQPPKVTTTTNSYVTETAFTPSTLSAAELTRMTTLCQNIQTNGSGFGICRSCREGGQ